MKRKDPCTTVGVTVVTKQVYGGDSCLLLCSTSTRKGAYFGYHNAITHLRQVRKVTKNKKNRDSKQSSARALLNEAMF
jgi:hypothetical protein